ncbi:hypothetical protein [Streptomyces scopuliridis]|uniref:hypothetical protein n=1 Tax=Streptomyces scopuliridis TaxID=452529 RepID=UPI0036C2A9F9
MKVTTARWILAPLSAWRTRQLMKAFGGRMSYEVAWGLTRFRYHADELPYIQDRELRIRLSAGVPDIPDPSHGRRRDKSSPPAVGPDRGED